MVKEATLALAARSTHEKLAEFLCYHLKVPSVFRQQNCGRTHSYLLCYMPLDIIVQVPFM
jgi:hypothetical protein